MYGGVRGSDLARQQAADLGPRPAIRMQIEIRPVEGRRREAQTINLKIKTQHSGGAGAPRRAEHCYRQTSLAEKVNS